MFKISIISLFIGGAFIVSIQSFSFVNKTEQYTSSEKDLFVDYDYYSVDEPDIRNWNSLNEIKIGQEGRVSKLNFTEEVLLSWEPIYTGVSDSGTKLVLGVSYQYSYRDSLGEVKIKQGESFTVWEPDVLSE